MFRVVFGGEVDTDYINQLRSALGESVGRLEVYAGVSENEKFSLLARSSLLLFPSYFEGFGYPPLEAALVGTPSVCYDLPVLRETLGTSGYFAPVGDISSFSHQARKALSSYTYGDGLRDRAEKIAGFDRISQKLSECMETWEPIPVEANHYTVLWGPWSANDIHHERSTDPKDDASVPPYGKASENTAGKVEVKIIIRTRDIAVSATMQIAGHSIRALAITSEPCERGWNRMELVFQLKKSHLDQKLTLTCHEKDGDLIHEESGIMVREVKC